VKETYAAKRAERLPCDRGSHIAAVLSSQWMFCINIFTVSPLRRRRINPRVRTKNSVFFPSRSTGFFASGGNRESDWNKATIKL
jgi:hypothetical protein